MQQFKLFQVGAISFMLGAVTLLLLIVVGIFIHQLTLTDEMADEGTPASVDTIDVMMETSD